MKTIILGVLFVLLASCSAPNDPHRYADCYPERAKVLGSNDSACGNGSDRTTVQFHDGQIRTMCINAERGDVVMVCR